MVGDLSVSDCMSRYSYPFSVTVNLEGKRFMDEGENHFGLTYAKNWRSDLAAAGLEGVSGLCSKDTVFVGATV